jgi:hypothetical protein
MEDHQSIPLFAIYCSVTYFLVTFQGFFCSLLYCFLNTEVNFFDDLFILCFILKVRDTLSRRLQATSIWARWKQYLGKKGRYRDGMTNSDDRTRSEFLLPQTTTSAVVRSFFYRF